MKLIYTGDFDKLKEFGFKYDEFNLAMCDYKYNIINIDDEINKYIEDKIKLELINNNQTTYARQYRTFGTPIPKKDMDKFPVLEKYKGQDISYIVYESIEIL